MIIFRVNFLWSTILITLSYVPVAMAIYLFIEWIFASFSFWTVEGYGLDSLLYNLLKILSGSIIPLHFFNQPLIYLLPTSFLVFHNTNIYLGKYSQIQIFQTFVGGILWCFVLFILARIVFKIGLKRNEAVGL